MGVPFVPLPGGYAGYNRQAKRVGPAVGKTARWNGRDFRAGPERDLVALRRAAGGIVDIKEITAGKGRGYSRGGIAGSRHTGSRVGRA